MATAKYLRKPPKQWVLPVTRGCDQVVTLRRRDQAGELADWESSVQMVIDIDRANPTVVSADVDGVYANLIISDEVCDQVKNTTRWRIVMSNNGIETPISVGTFERHDG